MTSICHPTGMLRQLLPMTRMSKTNKKDRPGTVSDSSTVNNKQRVLRTLFLNNNQICQLEKSGKGIVLLECLRSLADRRHAQLVSGEMGFDPRLLPCCLWKPLLAAFHRSAAASSSFRRSARQPGYCSLEQKFAVIRLCSPDRSPGYTERLWLSFRCSLSWNSPVGQNATKKGFGEQPGSPASLGVYAKARPSVKPTSKAVLHLRAS